MSDRRICKLDIKNANEQVLQETVRLLSSMIGAQIINRVKIWGGQTVDVPCGLQMTELKNGIGFRVQDGEIVSDGDPYGQREAYERAETLVKQTYGYVDSMQKLRSKGFIINSNIKIFGDKIKARIEGMKYA